MENEETLLALDKVFAKYGAVREPNAKYTWETFIRTPMKPTGTHHNITSFCLMNKSLSCSQTHIHEIDGKDSGGDTLIFFGGIRCETPEQVADILDRCEAIEFLPLIWEQRDKTA